MNTNKSTVAGATAQYTLTEAVTEAVETLKVNGSFSAHDVTVAVREAVNEGEYALPGSENPNTASNIKYLVNHEDVKNVLNLLNNDGTLVNLGLTNVDYSGPYRVYQFGATASATDDSPANDAAGVTDTATVAVDTDTDAADSDSPVAQKIATYLTNHGDSATIRQIHSSLKIAGLTSKDLVALVDDLGYTVTAGTEGAYSTYTVEA
jgi:hypothetical protein